VRHLQVFREGRKTDPGCGGVRLLGFAPVCDPVRRPVSVRSPNDASMGRSCLGLRSSFRVVGHRFHVQPRGLDPIESSGADQQPPAGSRRTHNLAAGQPIRSWAWDASSPIVQSPAERPPAAIECVTRPADRSRVRPALQRVRGADAWSSVARATHPRGATPCLRFCTVREHRQT